MPLLTTKINGFYRCVWFVCVVFSMEKNEISHRNEGIMALKIIHLIHLIRSWMHIWVIYCHYGSLLNGIRSKELRLNFYGNHSARTILAIISHNIHNLGVHSTHTRHRSHSFFLRRCCCCCSFWFWNAVLWWLIWSNDTEWEISITLNSSASEIIIYFFLRLHFSHVEFICDAVHV